MTERPAHTDPEHWRSRAEEARTIAEWMSNADARSGMIRAADEYDHLAERAQNRLLARQKTEARAP